MNNREILDLTLHLSQALDQNYDVINMDTVLAVISALEGTTITKEQLEATRLAKYINQLRRRTTNEALARRAKSLLKKWREMVGMQQTGADSLQQQQVIPSQTQQSLLGNSNENSVVSITLQRAPPSSPANNFGYNFCVNTVNNKCENEANISINNGSLSKSSNVINTHNRIADNLTSEKPIIPDVMTGSINADSDINRTTQQPTSFSNLISNLNSPFGKNASFFKINENVNSTHEKKDQKFQNHVEQSLPETFVIDNSSNSNSVSNFAVITSRLARDSITETADLPIVIDIDDSDSNDVEPKNNKLLLSPYDASSLINVPSSSTKAKKVKKEKKKKEKTNNLCNLEWSGVTVPISDLNSTTPLKNFKNNEKHELSSCRSVKNHQIVSDVSEILSLSNSSIFPAANNPVDIQNRMESSDLTFSGKFKQFSNNSTGLLNMNALLINHENLGSTNIKDTLTEKQPIVSNENSTASSRGSNLGTLGDMLAQQDKQDIQVNQNMNDPRIQINSSTNFEDISVPHIAPSTFATTTTTETVSVSAPQCELKSSVANRDDINVGAIHPKKRGRKKGSRGVDSIIAKETSLSHQILLGSGGKKVKTTKELFNEMQNRKLNQSLILATKSTDLNKIVGSAIHQHQKLQNSSRPTSSCSEPSLQSPQMLDATLVSHSSPDNISNLKQDYLESESDSGISGPPIISPKCISVKHHNSIDSGSNSQFIKSKLVSSLDTNDVGAQLLEIVKHLPGPQSVEVIERIHAEQTVPCTCSIIEEVTTLKEITNGDEEKINYSASSNKNELYGDNDDTAFSKRNQAQTSIGDADTGHKKQELIINLRKQKPKKSIFDLDFEDDEDPLHSIIAETTKGVTNDVKKDKEETTEESTIYGAAKNGLIAATEQHLNNALVNKNSEEAEENVVLFPSYRIEEDQNCLAKRRYEHQTNLVTDFHVSALHNCYIPNINGNWEDSQIGVMSAAAGQDYTISDGTDVVPKYGSIISDHIPKDLSHLNFNKSARIKPYQMPEVLFLGVAKCLPSCRNRNKRLYKNKREKCKETENINGRHKIKKTEDDIADAIILDAELRKPNYCLLPITGIDDEDEKRKLIHSPLSGSLDSAVENSSKYCMTSQSGQQNLNFSNLCLKEPENCINETLTQQHLFHMQSLNQNKSLIPKSETSKHTNYESKMNANAKRKRKKKKRDLEKQIDHTLLLEKMRERQQIKRIKIAINGNIATQRNIQTTGENSKKNSTDEEENEYNQRKINSLNHDRDRSAIDDEIFSDDANSLASNIDGNYERYYSEDSNIADNEQDDTEVERNNEGQYAVVQKPMNLTQSGKNHHIVLTIKKTPSKTLLPINSLSLEISPINSISSTSTNGFIKMSEFTTNTIHNSDQPAASVPFIKVEYDDVNHSTAMHKAEVSLSCNSSLNANCNMDDFDNSMVKEEVKNKLIAAGQLKTQKELKYQRVEGIRRRNFRTFPQASLELKHMFQNNDEKSSVKKLHHKLFFPHELFTRDNKGNCERLLNWSSCESSCAEDSEYDSISDINNKYESSTKSDMQAGAELKSKKHIDYDTFSESSFSKSPSISDAEDEKNPENFVNSTKIEALVDEPSLPLEDNGQLPTFTSIYVKQPQPHLTSTSQHPSEKCIGDNKSNTADKVFFNTHNDVHNESMLVANNTVSTEKVKNLKKGNITLTVLPEFRTGVRTVAYEGDNGTKTQKFKEWHEVLQLRSYNDELLTVLPYVVLE